MDKKYIHELEIMSKNISEKISAINPEITDELLDLLHEYLLINHVLDINKKADTDSIDDILHYIINPLK